MLITFTCIFNVDPVSYLIKSLKKDTYLNKQNRTNIEQLNTKIPKSKKTMLTFISLLQIKADFIIITKCHVNVRIDTLV